jgi:hypothetical protein
MGNYERISSNSVVYNKQIMGPIVKKILEKILCSTKDVFKMRSADFYLFRYHISY